MSILRVDIAIQRIREAGDPVTLSDIKPMAIASDENAWTYLNPVSAEAATLVNEFWSYTKGIDFSWRTKWTDEQCLRVEQSFDAHPQVLKMLDKASACTTLVYPIDYSLPPSQFINASMTRIQELRSYARVFNHNAICRASKGKTEEAAAIMLRQLHLARLQKQEPLMLGFLVQSACQGIGMYSLNGLLQTSSLSEETHQRIESELANHQPLKSVVHAIKTERAFGMDSIREQYGPFFMKMSIKDYLEITDSELASIAKPLFEVPAITPKTRNSFISPVDAFRPLIAEMRTAANRTEANLRALRVLNAIHAMIDRGESVDLQKLGLPSEVMVDPFNGKPLTIQPTPDGWLVYSVGSDLKDGGGNWNDQTDLGFGPPDLMPN